MDIFFLDMRTYPGDNPANEQAERSNAATFLGRAQIDWLKSGLARSRAPWKIIASDMPVGLLVRDGDAHFENMASGNGLVRGRESDIAEILGGTEHLNVRNVVWPTADVRFTAAHHYSHDLAQFQDFNPFRKFVSGPLRAGSFGPKVEYVKVPEPSQANLPPSDGLQFFGKIDFEGATGAMTVNLIDKADTVLWSKVLEPEFA